MNLMGGLHVEVSMYPDLLYIGNWEVFGLGALQYDQLGIR